MVLGVDPGSAKAGYAVLTPGGTVLTQGIEVLESLASRLEGVIALHGVDAVALGSGTNGRRVRELLNRFGLPIYWVNEFETSRRARSLCRPD